MEATTQKQMTAQTDGADIHATASSRRADWMIAFCLRHGLILLLALLLVFTLLPFAAPLAMYVGWESEGELLYRFYSLFCHQLPQRSWFLFGPKLTYSLAELQQVNPGLSPPELRAFVGTPALGWKVAWSDRMVAFYTLTPVFGLAYVMMRWAGRQIAPLPWTVLLILLLPLVIDGGTHAINDVLTGGTSVGGFRDTNQWLAWLTFDAFREFYVGDQFGTFNWWARLVTGSIAAWGVAFTVFPLIDQILQHETYLLANKP